MRNDKSHKIILFDGVCNLCNSWVNYVIKRDKHDVFRFASLQEDTGQELMKNLDLDFKQLDSIILIDENKVYYKSTAALKIAKQLGRPYSIAHALILIPKFIRDGVYDLVARNRYKWYGKSDSCMIPTPELRSKFL